MHCNLLLLTLILHVLLPLGVDGFAAKKASKNQKSTSKAGRGGGAGGRGGFRGFGAKPPTIDEIVSKLKTRMPADASTLDCPCGSGAKYDVCCGPFHRGDVLAQSPLDVLRSRYTAFKWRMPVYIMETTHPQCRDYREDRIDWVKDLDKSGMFDSYEFVELIPSPEEAGANDDEGFIEFRVRLEAKQNAGPDSAIGGQETVISERSRFLRDGEPFQWRYAGGDVRSDVAGLEDSVLNR